LFLPGELLRRKLGARPGGAGGHGRAGDLGDVPTACALDPLPQVVDAGIDGALAEAFRQLGVGEANQGLELKREGQKELPRIDECLEALVGGATFVARSFAGDPNQLSTLLKAAPAH
jgi:hypothetical protein